MLDDLLAPRLKLVVCGSAAGDRSVQLGQYYAGPGNKFWSTIAAVGLTPRRLRPAEYQLLLTFGIGLTDLIKEQSGTDTGIDFSGAEPASLRDKLLDFRPGILCFNGKRAGQEFLARASVAYGLQSERVGRTHLFIAPSTSGAASGSWDLSVWETLSNLV